MKRAARAESTERPALPSGDRATDSGPAERIRVLVVAGVRLYREGMALNLGNRERLSVVGSAASPVEALRLVKAIPPAVVVLDMAAEQSLDLVRALKEAAPPVKVIAFAVEEHEPEIIACAEAGVDGYVSCEGSMDDLTATIMSVSRGEFLCSPRVAATLLRRVGTLANGARPPRRGWPHLARVRGSAPDPRRAVEQGHRPPTAHRGRHGQEPRAQPAREAPRRLPGGSSVAARPSPDASARSSRWPLPGRPDRLIPVAPRTEPPRTEPPWIQSAWIQSGWIQSGWIEFP